MLEIINPADGSVIGGIDRDNPEAIRRKCEKAKVAQLPWAKRDLQERIDIILAFRAALVEQTSTLAQMLTRETGKPISQATNEVKGTLGRIDFFVENAEKALGEETVLKDVSGGMVERISREPLGVVTNISAWNYPYFVGVNVFIPALLAGNAVLYKPSEHAVLTGMSIARLLWDAGVPSDVFALIVGDGRAGDRLLKFPVDGVFFTGSVRVGMSIRDLLSRSTTKIQCEMGGKDPVYVRSDVDIEGAAAALADGAFYNCGQSCCAVERIYVHASIYDAFVQAFVKVVKAFVIGNPMDEKTYIGPLARQAQIDVIQSQVSDALAKGATLLCGGKAIEGPGSYYEPTVFTNVNHEMSVMRDESFGPIIGIQGVEDDDEAVKLMNDTSMGLTSGVFTKDAEVAEQLLAQLNSGSVYWNCCDRVSPRLPWSGRGLSGFGLTLSVEGITAFTRPKAWHLRQP